MRLAFYPTVLIGSRHLQNCYPLKSVWKVEAQSWTSPSITIHMPGKQQSLFESEKGSIRTPTGAMSIRKSKQAFRLSNTFISLPVSYLKPNVKLSGHWSFSFFLFYSFLYNYSYSYSFLFLFVFPRNIAWPGLGSSTCQAPEMLGLFLGYQTVIFLHLLLLYH